MTPPKKLKKLDAPVKTCANCEHYQPVEQPGRPMKLEGGLCRRYPKKFIPAPEGFEGFWTYPPTPASEKCGEHKLLCN
jgi:hypothetical protein